MLNLAPPRVIGFKKCIGLCVEEPQPPVINVNGKIEHRYLRLLVNLTIRKSATRDLLFAPVHG